MYRLEIVEALKNIKPGRYFHIEYQKAIPTKAGTIIRTTKTVVRYGVQYTNMKSVSKSTGSAELPNWLRWDEYKPYFLKYVGGDASKKGTTYLRVSLTKGRHKEHISYSVDGLPIDDSMSPGVVELLNKVNKGHPTSVMNINIDNIIKIGR